MRGVADRLDDLGDAVDHRQDGADQRLVRLAAARADIRQRVLGRMAQRLEAREVEKAAVAFHGVDETEDRIEPRAVAGVVLPGDDLARQCLEHVARFGYELGKQIIHQEPP